MTERLDEGYRDLGTADVHDVDDGKHQVVVHFPIVIDSFRSDFGPGAFEEGFRKQLPVMCTNHNQADLIGHAVSAQSMPDLHEVVGQFSNFDDVPSARRAFAHVRDGDYPGFSFHYVQGKTVPHPSGQRGAVRYAKARMIEFGPVVSPSIPGAVAVGLRAEEAALSIPTIDELIHLRDIGVLNDDGLRSAIAEHHPHLAEHITVQAPSKPKATADDGKYAEAFRSAIASAIEPFDLSGLIETDGKRAVAIAIHHDGTVTDGDGNAMGHPAPDDEVRQLASAVDASLDAYAQALGDADVSGLPANVQQALALATAAGNVSDELLDALGIDDPDDHGEDLDRSEAQMDEDDEASGKRAVLGTKDRNDLPDSAFAYIEPGGKKDADGKTVPRSLRHFPIMDAAHVRNALSRIGAGAKFGDEAKAKVHAAAKKFKIDVPIDQRSADEGPTREELIAKTLDRLGERVA